MSKKLNLILSLIVMVISFLGIFFVVNYEKNKTSIQEITLLEEKDSKVVNEINIKLSVFEVVLIYIFVLLILLAIINFLFIYAKLDYKNYVRNVVFIITILISSSIICCGIVYLVNNKIYVNIDSKDKHVESYIINPNGETELVKNETINNKKYSSYKNDSNALLIKSGSIISLNNSTIYKQGNTNNTMVSRIYGINSGILVLKDSTLNINNSTINTDADGGIGIVSVLSNSKVNIDMLTIDTSGEYSSGLLASIEGSITGDSIKIKTSSSNSPAISSLRSGVVRVNNAVIETNAASSPIIRTNGTINLYNTIGDANDSNIAYIDGNSSVTIDNSELKATGNNNSFDGAFVVDKNFLPNDYKSSTNLTISNSILEIKSQSKVYDKAPMFLVNSNNTVIDLTSNTLKYGSNVLLDVRNQNKSKNIIVKLNSSSQKLEGNIVVDSNSILEFSLKDTNYYGSINNKNSAKKVALNIDKDSKLSLLDDSYVSILKDDKEDFSNINSNGFNIYYNSKLNPELNNKSIKLSGGGLIKPM